MSNRSKILRRTALVLALVIVALIVYLRFGATRVHHNRIETAVSQAVGFDVTIDQPLSVNLGRKLEFAATDVAVRNPGDAAAEPLARIGKLRAVVDSRALFADRFEIDLLEIDAVQFDLGRIEDEPSPWAGEFSGLSGKARIENVTARPIVNLELAASNIELRSLSGEGDAATDEEGELLFDDVPIDISPLRTFDLTADVSADSVRLDDDVITDLHLEVSINDGSLSIDPLRFNSGDGNISTTVSLTPSGEQLALQLVARAENLRLIAMAVDDQASADLPPLDVTIELGGVGQSAHEILASSNGRITGRHETGTLNLQAAGLLFSDFVTSIVKTLNPLAKSREFTTLECGIYAIDIVDGVATIETLSAQTDRVTLISSGSINLETEKIDVALSTKSREGLGLSLGGVANSFVKLGGTLKEPALGVDAASSVTTTGAAVATGGLSVLAKSLWDRLSGEADLCSEDT